MAFKKFSKRKKGLIKDSASKIGDTEQIDIQKLSFKKRLFHNQGEGLFNISLWFPFFASSWLVSGIVGQQYLTLSLVFFPLIFIFLHTEKQLKEESNIQPNTNMVFVSLITIYSLYLFYRDPRYVITVLFFIAAQSRLILPIVNFRKNNQSNFSFIVSAIFPFIFFTCLMYLGMFSQTKDDFVVDDLKYFILVLIPGTVLISREMFRHSQFLKLKGWTFKNFIHKNDKSIIRPGGISRLIVGLMIIGPAIPALLLPFNIIPKSLFVVSLSFLKVPKLAEEIQSETGSFSERLLALTKFAAMVTALVFIGLFLGDKGII
jgi:hypothetical protein